ncbi:hypothetical protein [Sphingomonas profundi]|uniref:hypothetical protein n=1 Tax=Alterirhizorhabdus profundi TaxID=2681549 RepID=UPI0012E73190|nr:hypothetical protein [Sphingomonas profundi]
MQQPLFVADRASLDRAAELIDRFGIHARGEAATRASHSRDVGNVLHFCRWRQVERLILALSLAEPVGTLH